MDKTILLTDASASEFWEKHAQYLQRDIFPNDGEPLTDEDRAYFSSDEYRGQIDNLCTREIDPGRRVFFELGGERIGFCSYCFYRSEDCKCFLLDFCIYPAYRRQGYGTACFAAIARRERQARYFELNVSGEESRSFWKRLGFRYNGYDEHGSILYTLLQQPSGEVLCEQPREGDEWQLLRLQNGLAAQEGRPLLSERQQEQFLERCAAQPPLCAYCETRMVGVLCEGKVFIEPVQRGRGIAALLAEKAGVEACPEAEDCRFGETL
ncbi:MAG: GNAT family N-acetyltransferase [Oscillospiraceae bacterium]|jgi:GNAT superfamily N-acetyltransferase|nr:GNAT family N-acetyltransferase [Oscillospiraceae bacterium]